MLRRSSLLVAMTALAAALVPVAPAAADLTSLLATCTEQDGIRFCDDGVPDAGGRTPNPGGAKAIEVPAAYAGHEGLPPADALAAAQVPGNSAGKIAIDADLTLPATPAPAEGYPLVVFMHGCCSGNKTDYESPRIDNSSELWHYNNRWFALRGYAVLTYTSRGFVTTTPSGDKGSTGETQIDHRAFEINDFQHLAGQLADEPGLGIDPQRILTIGGSYGGGFGWMALTDPRWQSPAGKPMKLAAVVTKYGWSDLAYSLVPTGMHLPGTLPAFDGTDSTQPLGMLKRSFTAALFLSGVAGLPGTSGRHATFPPQITQTLACLSGGDPGQQPPVACDGAAATVKSFVENRSPYYQNDFFAALASEPSLATPVYVGGTFSDQLFTAIETLRMVQRLQTAVPGYPVQQYFGDYLHAAQSKAKEWADLCGEDRHICAPADGSTATGDSVPPNRVAVGVNTRLNRFVDHYVKPTANPDEPRPPFDVTASLYVCKANAGPGRPLDEPGERFTAPTFGALAPNELAVAFDQARQTTYVVPRNDHAAQADPVFNAASNGSSCPTTRTPTPEGAASWQTDPLTEDATMIGLSRVTYRYTASAADPKTLQLNTRMYDVAPDGSATLIDRGVRRLTAAGGEVTYALHGQGWRFERGHAIRIEATQDDDPYIRRSTTPSSISIARAELRVPVREAGVVATPAAAGSPPGEQPPPRAEPCRRSALERATARPTRRGLRFRVERLDGPVAVSVFRLSRKRKVHGHLLVARFRRRGSFTWNGRPNRPRRRTTGGVYEVRFRYRGDAARLALERRRGRFRSRPDYSRSPHCGIVPVFRLSRPVLGGRTRRGANITFRLARRGDVTIRVGNGPRTLRTFRRRDVPAQRRVQVRLRARGLPRGTIRVRMRARFRGGRSVTRTIAARRI